MRSVSANGYIVAGVNVRGAVPIVSIARHAREEDFIPTKPAQVMIGLSPPRPEALRSLKLNRLIAEILSHARDRAAACPGWSPRNLRISAVPFVSDIVSGFSPVHDPPRIGGKNKNQCLTPGSLAVDTALARFGKLVDELDGLIKNH